MKAENALGELSSVPVEVASDIDPSALIQSAAGGPQVFVGAKNGIKIDVRVRVEDASGRGQIDHLESDNRDIVAATSTRAGGRIVVSADPAVLR